MLSGAFSSELSSRMLQTIIDLANFGIFVLDKDYRYQFFNKAHSDVMNASFNALPSDGACILDLVHDETLKHRMRQTLDRALAGESFMAELELPTLDQGRVSRELKFSLVQGDSDQSEFVVVFSRDISAKKEAEKNLESCEARFSTAFNASPVPMTITDLDDWGRIVEFNDAMVRFLGYSRSEVIGRTTRELNVWADPEQRKEGVKSLLTGKPVRDWECTFLAKDGTERLVRLSAELIRLNGKNCALSTLVDITDREKALAELKRRAGELEEANRMKDVFTDVLRHDLLSPISAISFTTEFLLKTERDPEKLKIYTRIKNSAANLAQMCEHASRFAKLENHDKIELSPQPLLPLLEEVLQDFEHSLREKRITLRCKVPAECRAALNPLIKDVFANLLSNAIKHGPRDGTVEIIACETAASWIISVTDDGDGVLPADKARIFDRFERVAESGVSGVGLGLAIAKQIVRIHRGRIWVGDGPDGRGNAFCVELPKFPE